MTDRSVAGQSTRSARFVEGQGRSPNCVGERCGNLPDTIASRSILIDMRRRAPGEVVEPFRHRHHADEAKPIMEALAEWCAEHEAEFYRADPQMPQGIEDRDADCWEPLLAIADVAGADWPRRAREAAVAIVARSAERTQTNGVQLLSISLRCSRAPTSSQPKPSFIDCMSYRSRRGRTFTASHKSARTCNAAQAGLALSLRS
jgi:hypothetical protein